MKNSKINQTTEEEYREAMASADYDWFPKNPYDEDAPYTTLERDFEEYQKELQKEAEEEAYRIKFWQPRYGLSGHEYPRD